MINLNTGTLTIVVINNTASKLRMSKNEFISQFFRSILKKRILCIFWIKIQSSDITLELYVSLMSFEMEPFPPLPHLPLCLTIVTFWSVWVCFLVEFPTFWIGLIFSWCCVNGAVCLSENVRFYLFCYFPPFLRLQELIHLPMNIHF